ncbi:MAG: TIGR00269 family protein [Candidatus Thermoplasmatota archaeon]|nr:TIGR00269 family protein [Candidatus Thermoplasmatota archaeon]
MRCSKCNKKAVTFIRYSGMHLCKFHFNEFFEKRVKKTLRKQNVEGKIAVGVSGGKDSTVALYILKKFFGKRKDITIEAVTVDEGIKGYRENSIKVVKKICEEWDVRYHVIGFKGQIGYSMDEIKQKFMCSYCGVFRRYLLNIKAKEIKADRIATGHNLDDTAQSILMNIAKGDVEKLARLGPHVKIQKGLVPRIEPLRVIPEKENYLYALLNNIDFYSGECPYAYTAQRNMYREILYELENNSPGTRHAILKTYDSISDLLRKKFPPAKLKKCELCNEPTSQIICNTCKLKKELIKQRE